MRVVSMISDHYQRQYPLPQVNWPQPAQFLDTKEYLLGHLTYADFLLAYTASFFCVTALSLGLESPFCKHDNLKQLCQRVKDLPAIKALVDKRKAVPYMPPTMIPFPLMTCAEVEAKKSQ